MKSYTLTRCRDCKHEAIRYCNVKKCRECGGRLERPTPSDVTRERLKLARQIVDRAKLWAVYDPALAELIRKWEVE